MVAYLKTQSVLELNNFSNLSIVAYKGVAYKKKSCNRNKIAPVDTARIFRINSMIQYKLQVLRSIFVTTQKNQCRIRYARLGLVDYLTAANGICLFRQLIGILGDGNIPPKISGNTKDMTMTFLPEVGAYK